MLEAIPADSARTFLHFSYSYLTSVGATLAMESYLNTIGADREGFSVSDIRPDGKPSLVRGIRGALERNTMRYYLAIEAYLDTLSAPAEQRFEKRLRDWYSLAERYRQLRDLDLQEYLDTKLKALRAQHGEP